MTFGDGDITAAAQAICAERCAHMGEPPCWRIQDDRGTYLPWPSPACDDPGCLWLAKAALGALADKVV